ncbi:MAG TPA: hypothetical protein VLK32_01390, partial [Bacillota bacterium]|nr:hypothetical protein [Bacillota bacterium]
MALLLIILVAAAGVWTMPEWGRDKEFDDEMAISNSQVLLNTGFDFGRMFFRSRQRPAFVFFVMPVVAMFPNDDLVFEGRSPSDFGKRVWQVYWREGRKVFPEISQLMMAVFLASFVGLFFVFRHFTRETALSGLMTLLTLYFLRDVPSAAVLTQSFGLFVHVAVALSFLMWVETPTPGRLALSAMAVSVGVLTKEDIIVSLAAVLAYQAYLVLRNSPVLRQFIAYWLVAAVLPLAWYTFVLDGLASEIIGLYQEHIDTQALMGYPGTTWSMGISYMKSLYWPVFPIVVPLAVAYLCMSRFSRLALQLPHRSGAGALFFTALALAQTSAFTMPYTFPRLLVYYAPAFGYFAIASTALCFALLSRPLQRL